jgi:hypothetical protein
VAGGRRLTAAAPSLGGCPVFAAGDLGNVRVDALPVHAQSAACVATIGAGNGPDAVAMCAIAPAP